METASNLQSRVCDRLPCWRSILPLERVRPRLGLSVTHLLCRSPSFAEIKGPPSLCCSPGLDLEAFVMLKPHYSSHARGSLLKRLSMSLSTDPANSLLVPPTKSNSRCPPPPPTHPLRSPTRTFGASYSSARTDLSRTTKVFHCNPVHTRLVN